MKGKREQPINLTDIGRNNTTRVRRLPYGEPGYVDEDGWVTQEDGTQTRPIVGVENKSNKFSGKMRSANEPSPNTNNDVGFVVVAMSENNNKDLKHGPTLPQIPDYNELLRLEAEGATIIESSAYFPESRQTVTTRSQTVAERYDELERERYDY